MSKDEELERLRQENQALQEANQTLREGLLEAIQVIDAHQRRVKELEEVVASQQERMKALQARLAKDSHNSSLPPSSDRFIRAPKSLRNAHFTPSMRHT
jgi:transposase